MLQGEQQKKQVAGIVSRRYFILKKRSEKITLNSFHFNSRLLLEIRLIWDINDGVMKSDIGRKINENCPRFERNWAQNGPKIEPKVTETWISIKTYLNSTR